MLLFFLLLLVSTNVLISATENKNNLCGRSKLTQKCWCRHVADKDTQFFEKLADCRGIDIKVFPNSDDIKSINILDLSQNQITALNGNGLKLTNLKKLQLAFNSIKNMDSSFFNEVTHLHQLDLSHNNIQNIAVNMFSNLKKLARLDLSFNELAEVPVELFENLRHLKFFDISYNPFGKWIMKNTTGLEYRFKLPFNLTHLTMNSVGLTQISGSFFRSYENLKYISMTDNEFQFIPLLPSNIEYLDLSGNNISFLSHGYLQYSKLKVLKLDRMNALKTIEPKAFFVLYSLERLHINDCPNLNEFNKEAFGDVTRDILKVKSISLARNGLHSLDQNFGYLFNKLEYINLNDNPWKCDCNLLWLNGYKKSLLKSADIRCSLPRRLEEKQLLQLQESDLIQCYPEKYGKKSHRILIIGLVFTVILLVAVIAYLLKYPYMPPPLNRNVSPTSPYSVPTESITRS